MPGPAAAKTTPVAPAGDAAPAAQAQVESHEGGARVILAGDWRAAAETPSFAPQLAQGQGPISFDASALKAWDTRLAAELWSAMAAAQREHRKIDSSGLPEGLRAVLELALPAPPATGEAPQKGPVPAGGQPSAPPGDGASAPASDRVRGTGWLGRVGKSFTASWSRARCTLGFLGEVVVSLGRLARGRSGLRWRDLVWQLDQTGPRSLPIVSLVSFLVGLIWPTWVPRNCSASAPRSTLPTW